MRRNVGGQFLTFSLLTRADGQPLLGANPTVYLTLDGADQVATLNTVQERGNGQYVVELAQSETRAASIGYVAVVAGAILTEKTVYTREAP